MPVIVNAFDSTLELLECGGPIYNVFQKIKELVHDALGEVHSDVSVPFFELLSECGDVSDIGFGWLRLPNLVLLIEESLLLRVFPNCPLHFVHLAMNLTLSLVIIQGGHATQVKEGQLC